MCVCVCVHALSHPTLCDPMDCSPAGSSVHRIYQARILEWLTISFSRALPDPGIEPTSPESPVSHIIKPALNKMLKQLL